MPRLVVASFLLVLVLVAPARAAFMPLPTPCPDAEVAGFAVSGSAWLALCADRPQGSGRYRTTARMSRDGGQSWSTLEWHPAAVPSYAYPFVTGVTVAPDGAFHVGVGPVPDGQALARVVRVDPTTGAMAVVRELPVPAAARISPSAWDAEGRMWLAVSDGASVNGMVTLLRLGAAGAPELTSAPVPYGSFQHLEVVHRPSGTFVRVGFAAYRLDGTALTYVRGGLPAYEEGPLLAAPYGLSLDGGVSWMEERGTRAVEGDPTLLVRGMRVLRRHSPSFFAPTGLVLPAAGARVLRTSHGLLAVTDGFQRPNLGSEATEAFALHVGEVPAPPAATGPLSPTFEAWLARANAFRAQAGLPPLVGDHVVSAAAENHSRYWTMNPKPAATLSLHDETPGAPGFTGEHPSDRCAAVGAQPSCNEVMHTGGSDDPVGGWVATVFHRFAFLDPTALTIGGGRVEGGPAVANGSEKAGLVVAPIPFPAGRYDGPLSFSGEAPDPVESCREDDQPVDWPLGTAVTVYLPGGDVGEFRVAPEGGAPLRGCEIGHNFLPDDPLRPGTTYRVTATWWPTREMGPRPFSWTFTTAGEAEPVDDDEERTTPSHCTPTLTAPRKVARRTQLTLRYRACARGSVTAGLYRMKPRTKAQRRPLVTRTAALRTPRRAGLKLSTKRLVPGRYRLRAALKGGRGRTLTQVVTVTKPRRR